MDRICFFKSKHLEIWSNVSTIIHQEWQNLLKFRNSNARPRTGPRMLSLTGPRDLPQLGDSHGRNGLQDTNKRSSSPEKNATCNRPPNQRPGAKRDQRGESWHTVIQYPGIQSSKLFSLYAILIWDTPNLNCSTYHPIYSVSHVNTASQSFCISWNFSSSKSCGFSTASSSQTALDFKGSALSLSSAIRCPWFSSCEYYIKSKSNKIRRPRNTSTKKNCKKIIPGPTYKNSHLGLATIPCCLRPAAEEPKAQRSDVKAAPVVGLHYATGCSW